MADLREWLANLPKEQQEETLKINGHRHFIWLGDFEDGDHRRGNYVDDHWGRAERRDRRNLEHDEQVKLFEWAALNAGRFPELEYLHAVPNGGHRHPGVAVKLKAEGVKAGVWDVNLDCARHGYHGLKIEMKAGENTLTDNQRRWGAFYETQGYKTAVCYGWVEAAQVIMEYLGGSDGED
jgi:hypothetical protein